MHNKKSHVYLLVNIQYYCFSTIFQCISLCCLVISACHRTKMILLPRARAHTHPNTIWEIINESQTKYERKKIIFIFQQRYWVKAHSRRKYYKLRFSECCCIQLIFTVAQKNVIKTDFSHFYYYCYAFFFSSLHIRSVYVCRVLSPHHFHQLLIFSTCCCLFSFSLSYWFCSCTPSNVYDSNRIMHIESIVRARVHHHHIDANGKNCKISFKK